MKTEVLCSAESPCAHGRRAKIPPSGNSLIESIESIVNYNFEASTLFESSLSGEVQILNSINLENGGIKVYEQNESLINDVYLNSLAVGETDNIVDNAATILNVASQCPIAGGPAVYRARALYFLIDPEMEYNDEVTCLQAGYLYKIAKSINGKSKLYPNPATHDITVVYNISKKSTLKIIDGIGKTIKDFELDPFEINFNFNIESIANGLYSYQIVDIDKKLIDTGQFVISK